MGSSVNTSVNTEIQTSTNQIFQSAQSVCQANCTAVNENINVVITNGSKVGNINITNQCTASALCTMRSNLSSITEQQLEAVQQAQAKNNGNSWFTWPGMSINTTSNFLEQTLQNSYTQTITNVCNATTTDLNKDINVYVSGSTVADVNISNIGNASASCSIDNTISASVTQNESSNQSATSTNGSISVLIVAIIAIAVVIIVVVWLGASQRKQQSTEQQEQTKRNTLFELEEGLAASGLGASHPNISPNRAALTESALTSRLGIGRIPLTTKTTS
jgi:hypothetical protein